MEESVKGISSERVEQRIVNLLLKFAQKVGERRQGKIRISIYLTRQEIADMVGSTVETTIRVLSRLTKMGLLETKSKIIFLKDVKRLREIAEEGFDL